MSETQLLTASEVLIKHGLNWEVGAKPIYDENGQQLSDYSAITRLDNNHVFQIAGSGYQIGQQAAVLRFIDDITETGQAKYVRAGSFKWGAVVFVQAEIPSMTFEPVKGDEVKSYLTGITSHDGSLPVSIYPTAIRIICQNTLTASYREAIYKVSARHTEHMNSRIMSQATSILSKEIAYFKAFSEKCRALAGKEMLSLEIDTFLNDLFKIDAEIKTSTKTKNIRDEVMALVEVGKGSNIQGVRGTAWGVYNAVTEYIDHNRSTKNDQRDYASMLGSGATLRERAFDLLLNK